ncbi:MAG TPA: transcriptional regulator NrdR [Acidimicrobiia bacterium]|jgi:transcriptional repressor NrdR|nr:transcriptional regulator NrdR [Acidimicrobiia bacterium]
MHCPFCSGDDTRVVDSRAADAGSSIRRRRECVTCTRRFTTYERPVIAHMVRKRNGGLEPFDGHKLRRGVERALAGRPVAEGSVDRLVADLSAFVGAQGGEVSADELGDEVLVRLRDIDEVAYLRFASVYKEFQGAEDFEREVAALEGDG